MRDFLQESRLPVSEVKVILIAIQRIFVSKSSHHSHINFILQYLEFLLDDSNHCQEQDEKRILSTVVQIKANRPKQTNKTGNDERTEKYLDGTVLDAPETSLQSGTEKSHL